MTTTPISTIPLLTLEDYINHDDGTDSRYSLLDGRLIPMPPATKRHRRIAKFLEKRFEEEIERLDLPWETGRGDVEIATLGAKATRRPDVVVFDSGLLEPDDVDILNSPPRLVVEVVSPGEANRDRDYVTKEAEYAEFGIGEYWTVDAVSKTPNVTVRILVEGKYAIAVFAGNQRVVSRVFPDLILTAAEILSVS